MAINFHNVGKETDIKILEAQSYQIRKYKKTTPRHTIKLSKVEDKDRI